MSENRDLRSESPLRPERCEKKYVEKNALFWHLRNMMQQDASISSNADAFGRRPADDWT
jgi:hypothetical protein